MRTAIYEPFRAIRSLLSPPALRASAAPAATAGASAAPTSVPASSAASEASNAGERAGKPAGDAAPVRRPRIRFIHNYYYPDVSSVSQVITDIAAYLAAEGCSVSVVASKNLYGGGDASALATRERLDGVRVRRVWGPSFGRLSLLGRLLDQMAFMAGATRSALFAPRADAVVLLTNPPFFAVLGLLLRFFRREKFVHVVMDLYPDIAIASGHLSPRSPVAWLLRAVTRITLRSADRLIVLGDCMRDRVLSYGVDPMRVEVIRNWADEDAVTPVRREENPFRREMGWDDSFVVMYSGNMGVAHDFSDILEVARRTRERPDIVYAFVGDGVRRAELEEAKERDGLANVVLLPYQEQSVLAYSLGAGDLHLITLRDGFDGLVVPSKAYGVMAAARPIVYVGSARGEVARMVAEHDVGRVVPSGNPRELEAVILGMAADSRGRAEMGGRARDVLLRRHNRAASLARYREVLLGDLPRLRLARG